MSTDSVANTRFRFGDGAVHCHQLIMCRGGGVVVNKLKLMKNDLRAADFLAYFFFFSLSLSFLNKEGTKTGGRDSKNKIQISARHHIHTARNM